MAAPIVRYYDVLSQGSGLIAGLMAPGGNTGGPVGQLITGNLSHGNVLGGDWKVKTICIGFEGNTADQIGFWLYDQIADVAGQTEDFYASGAEWGFRIRISKDYIANFTSGEIMSSPWVDLPHGINATPFDLTTAVTNAGSGAVNGSQVMVASQNFSNVNLLNAFVHIAMKPAVAAIAGDTNNFGYRLTAVYP